MAPRFLENFSVPLFYSVLCKEKWLKITLIYILKSIIFTVPTAVTLHL